MPARTFHDEHQISLPQLYARLSSSELGLSKGQVKDKLIQAGHNILETKKKTPLFIKFLGQFTNFFALLLLFGATLAFVAEKLAPGDGNLYIGIALAIVVLLNAVFTFIQEYQSEKIMESFKRMMPDSVEVMRDGVRIQVSSRELVPGDVIFLDEGQRVPADARLIEQHAMKVDHSSITGESEPQLRSVACTHDDILESRNMVFSGTLVQTGNGRAMVYSTGMHTQIGRIVSLTKETKSVDTPLHRELTHFIKIISSIAIFLGVSFFLASFFLGHRLIGSLIFAIGIIVANVPEGLLPTVTLSLSMASKRMAKKKALIKNLESVETLGSTTVICTDKTGTLTQNRMQVSTLVLDGKELNALGDGLESHNAFKFLIRTMALCNNAHEGEGGFLGDPTETALMSFASKFANVKTLAESEPRVQEFPFDSQTKRMITTNKVAGREIAYLKGAPEVVLNDCDHVLHNGKIKVMSSEMRGELEKSYKSLASKGQRVLGFAFKHMAEREKFIFIGLCGMVDPPRPEVPGAIKQCRTAGIRVIMITGDYSLTAESIAREVGLLDEGDANIVTGDMLENMDEHELQETLQKPNLIFARTAPAHKLRIVKALQSGGDVVTVTGDGVNDAPALKNADMGVSMGLIGTEVAREASNMVLLDDNFATIVHAVEEGRTIFDNLKKFIAYILTSNVPQILPFIAFVLLGIPLPLTVVLILAIDLGTDLIPALGLGKERPESDVMQNKPRSRSERLLTPQLLFMSYGVVGMLQAAAGFFAYFYVLYHGGWVWGQELAVSDPLYLKAVSAFFASIIICQITDVLICRTRRQSLFKVGVFSNKLVLVGIGSELVLLAIMLFVPAVQPFFGTAPLTLFELSLSIPFALAILMWGEFRKWMIRRGNGFFNRYLMW